MCLQICNASLLMETYTLTQRAFAIPWWSRALTFIFIKGLGAVVICKHPEPSAGVPPACRWELFHDIRIVAGDYGWCKLTVRCVEVSHPWPAGPVNNGVPAGDGEPATPSLAGRHS